MKQTIINQSIPTNRHSAMKQFFNRLMVIAICMTVLPASAIMAQRTITGVILSSDDQEPLIGASVSVSETQLKNAGSKAKTLGTVTDILTLIL